MTRGEWRYVWVVLSLFGLWGMATAQSGGQFCVRAFEDRSGNGRLDLGEPALTGGLSVDLAAGDGIIIASALLDDSPIAAQGVICFQFLPTGTYTVTIASPNFTPTTPTTFTATINAGALPTVFEYGGLHIDGNAASGILRPQRTDEAQRKRLERLLISGSGALVVIMGMTALGLVIYLLVFYERAPRPIPRDPRRTTAALPVVRPRDTGEIPRKQ